MAAKQGLTAQLSQASEDAKRAVLSRGWLNIPNNLNTVCTIKSAPDRTPAVLEKLAVHAGWLYKRNEQHVWQARWCCVVPHMFLYYFDQGSGEMVAAGPAGSHAGGGADAIHHGHGGGSAALSSSIAGLPPPPPPNASQQEFWNQSVAQGFGNRKPHEKRSHFYLFPTTPAVNNSANGGSNGNINGAAQAGGNMATIAEGNAFSTTPTGAGMSGDMDGSANDHHNNLTATAPASLQPAGIIDLECYSAVHRRTNTNYANNAAPTISQTAAGSSTVFELAGDQDLNPDLRAFYFCAADSNDADGWTQALLQGRHSALVDECEAYRQVAQGFSEQLQELHVQLDTCLAESAQAQDELYGVRSQMEHERRAVWNMTQEFLASTTIDQEERSAKDSNNALDGSFSSFPNTDQSSVASSTPPFAPWRHVKSEARQRLGEARALSSSPDVTTAVQLLCNFMQSLHEVGMHQAHELTAAQGKLEQSGQSDHAKLQELSQTVDSLQAQLDQERAARQKDQATHAHQVQSLVAEKGQLQKGLDSMRLEVTMTQQQQQKKLAELTSHKKILKKEVLELRKSLDEARELINKTVSDNQSAQLQAEQEKAKAALLERYVQKVESQVQVQQNMMEMLSQAGSVYNGGGTGTGGSVYGGSVGGRDRGGGSVGGRDRDRGGSIARSYHHHAEPAAQAPPPPSRSIVVVQTAEKMSHHHRHHEDVTRQPSNDDDDDDEVEDNDIEEEGHTDDDDGGLEEEHVTSHRRRSSSRARESETHIVRPGFPPSHDVRRQISSSSLGYYDDVDNKSHVSELTEDRTQRHLDTLSFQHHQQQHQATSHSYLSGDGHHGQHRTSRSSPRWGTPSSSSPRILPNQNSPHTMTPPSAGSKNRPPSYIIGVNDGKGGNHLSGNLDTIQGGSMQQHRPPVAAAMSPGSSRKKLSVAQRARLEAERGQTTPVRLRGDRLTGKTGISSSPPAPTVTTTTASTSATATTHSSSKSNRDHSTSCNANGDAVSESGSVWRRMEEAVLGPRLESSEEESSSSSASVRSSHVTDYSESHDTQPRSGGASHRRRAANSMSDEKKTEALSLQERSQLQRQKQLEFLKNQGLINGEADIRGGAGANPGESRSVETRKS